MKKKVYIPRFPGHSIGNVTEGPLHHGQVLAIIVGLARETH